MKFLEEYKMFVLDLLDKQEFIRNLGVTNQEASKWMNSSLISYDDWLYNHELKLLKFKDRIYDHPLVVGNMVVIADDCPEEELKKVLSVCGTVSLDKFMDKGGMVKMCEENIHGWGGTDYICGIDFSGIKFQCSTKFFLWWTKWEYKIFENRIVFTFCKNSKIVLGIPSFPLIENKEIIYEVYYQDDLK